MALACAVATADVANATAATGGDQLWLSSFKGPAIRDGDGKVAVSPDGTKVFVTGSTSEGPHPNNIATIAYDAITGARIWGSLYYALGSDVPMAMVCSPDGSRVYVTGRSHGSATGWNYTTIAYDAATGAMGWVATYTKRGGGSDIPHAMASSPDGATLFVTGSSWGGPSEGDDYATVAYDAATGSQLWTARYNSSADGEETANGLVVSPDGSRVVVTGSSDVPDSGADFATAAYGAATGELLWTARYNGKANMDDIADAVAISPDGSKVFVTGQSMATSTGYDFATVAYDESSGSVLWGARYHGIGTDIPTAIAASPDGAKVYVTGEGTGDYATAAYDATTGVIQWTARYAGPDGGSDRAHALAADPNGSEVFVTGQSFGTGTSDDYATVAYDAFTGSELWASRYDGAANGFDAAASVAGSPDGTKVFVAGESAGPGGLQDFQIVTVAYQS